jgi:hypothetical protein
MRAITAERQASRRSWGEIPATELGSTAELRACSAVKRFIARDYAGMGHDLAQARVMLSERDPAARQPTGLAAQRNDPESGAFFALKAAEARLLLVSGQLDRARAALVEHPPTGRGQEPPALVRRWRPS